MIYLSNKTNIFIYSLPVDMRKSIDGLSLLVDEALNQLPQSGSLYIFHNKSSNKVKVLYWDKNGFIMHYKRMEKGRFKFPKSNDEYHYKISHDQLSWLLAGLDFILMDTFSELDFSHYS